MTEPLGLRLPADLAQPNRARLEFAFRVACGWYNREAVIIESEPEPTYPFLHYGADIAALYRPLTDAPTTRLLHGLGEEGRPDWLGELFSWISGEVEQFQPGDKWGRKGFQQSHQQRFAISPFHASAVEAAQNLFPDLELPQARLLAPTHDVDFLPTGLLSVLHRGLKNAAILLLQYQDVRGAAKVTLKTLTALGGGRPFVPLREWVWRESEAGFQGSYYFLTGGSHPKDGNYSPELARTTAGSVESLGAEVGIHGSWRSLESAGALEKEYAVVPQAVGGRQHYLRYDGSSQLALTLESLGAEYDSTAGWHDHPGYRHGSTLPFPVYDLRSERATGVIEIPLVLMDVAMAGTDPYEIFRSEFPSAFAILWHDTVMSGMQHPLNAAPLFWQLCGESRFECLRACQISSLFRQRFQLSGALLA